MKIYVDLDGVLADFEKGFKDKYATDVTTLSYEELKKFKPDFATHNFFGSLPVFPGAKKFVDDLAKMGHDVEILTAVSEFDSKENAKQKAKWVKRNIGSYKFNWVKKSVEKAKFADKGVLLIDDRDKSILPFKRAGGLTIKHTKIPNTLKLVKLLKESEMKTYKELVNEVGFNTRPRKPAKKFAFKVGDTVVVKEKGHDLDGKTVKVIKSRDRGANGMYAVETPGSLISVTVHQDSLTKVK